AIGQMPGNADLHNNLGAVLFRLGRADDAAACYREALELDPTCEEALLNLAALLSEADRLDEAIACYRRAIEQNPDRPTTHHNLGAPHLRSEQLAEAACRFQAAIRLRPDFPEAHNNLGAAYLRLGRQPEAIPCLREAIRQQPDFAAAHVNLSIALLATGEMSEGWAEYEWRWQAELLLIARRNFAQPQWHGAPAAGRILLVHAEQGFGDTLQFCRYAPLARARGWRVIIEAPAPLVRLLRGLQGVDRLVASGVALPEFDLHCPMLSLPLALGTT